MSLSNIPTMERVLTLLATVQTNTAPIELTIGYVDHNNIVQHDAVVVRKAPPRVVEVVVNTFPFVGLNEDGLRILTRREPEDTDTAD